MTRIKISYDYAGIMAVGLWAAIIVAYYGGTQLGQILLLDPNLAGPVWPPSGIAIAAILRWGYRVGPAIFIGSLEVLFRNRIHSILLTLTAMESEAKAVSRR